MEPGNLDGTGLGRARLRPRRREGRGGSSSSRPGRAANGPPPRAAWRERGRDHTILFAAKVAGDLASTGGGERRAGGCGGHARGNRRCTGADADADADTGQLAARGPGLRVPHLVAVGTSTSSPLLHGHPGIPRCHLDRTHPLLDCRTGGPGWGMGRHHLFLGPLRRWCLFTTGPPAGLLCDGGWTRRGRYRTASQVGMQREPPPALCNSAQGAT